MSARILLFAAGLAFALSAIAGLILMAWWPSLASLGGIALALAFSVACLHLASTARRPMPSCAGCGRQREGAFSFCARCGAT